MRPLIFLLAMTAEKLNDARHGIRAEQRRLWSTHDLDAIHIASCEAAEFEPATLLVQWDPIQQNFVVIKITASRKNGGGSPQASAANHGEAGNLPQHIAGEKLLLLLDLLTRDHSDAGADLLGRSRRASSRYNNFLLHRSETTHGEFLIRRLYSRLKSGNANFD